MQDEVPIQTDNKSFERGNNTNIGGKKPPNKSKFYSERN